MGIIKSCRASIRNFSHHIFDEMLKRDPFAVFIALFICSGPYFYATMCVALEYEQSKFTAATQTFSLIQQCQHAAFTRIKAKWRVTKCP